jgi:hypothetical protein
VSDDARSKPEVILSARQLQTGPVVMVKHRNGSATAKRSVHAFSPNVLFFGDLPDAILMSIATAPRRH